MKNKCQICGLVVTGDVIQHITSKEHEEALKVFLEKEAAQQKRAADGDKVFRVIDDFSIDEWEAAQRPRKSPAHE